MKDSLSKKRWMMSEKFHPRLNYGLYIYAHTCTHMNTYVHTHNTCIKVLLIAEHKGELTLNENR